MYIQKCNNNINNFKKQKTIIPGNNNLFKVTDTLNKVWLIFVLKGTPNYKNKANTFINYQPWHIRNPDTFVIRGIFRTLEYSKVRQYLHPCQTNCNIFRK